jgi:hypothetical protein
VKWYYSYILRYSIYFSSSKHVRQADFDFDHLALELDEQEIFRPSHFDKENRMPHLNLQKLFDRLNDIIDAQSAVKESSETNEDEEYYPWKKEDVEKLTSLAMNDDDSGNPTECE